MDTEIAKKELEKLELKRSRARKYMQERAKRENKRLYVRGPYKKTRDTPKVAETC
jgi:hypothetical protein